MRTLVVLFRKVSVRVGQVFMTMPVDMAWRHAPCGMGVGMAGVVTVFMHAFNHLVRVRVLVPSTQVQPRQRVTLKRRDRPCGIATATSPPR